MNVGSAAEGFYHVGILAQMGHDAKFDLRIVGGEENTVFVFGCKGFPDFTSQLIAYRNVLQVRIGRTEAAGRGDCLVVGRVDLAGFRVDQFGQGVDIGAEQLLQPAIFEQLSHDGMFGTHFFQYFFTRAIAACLCLPRFLFYLEVIEKDFADLPGGIDVELHSCQFVDLFLQLLECGRQFLGRLFQGDGVKRHSRIFHFSQYIY